MRVIAGSLGGRILKAPRGSRTRPTADRVREALFSMLGSMSNASVLDLYAGTGALGIEALSRDAGRAVFVERAHAALSCLRDNISTLGLGERALVVPMVVERASGEMARLGPFDLIFCDPPWAMVPQVWRLLANFGIEGYLASAGRLVLEHPEKLTVTPETFGPLSLVRTRIWGGSAATILQRDVRPGHC